MDLKVLEVMKRFKVPLFDFFEMAPNYYVLKTDELVSPACLSELRAAFPSFVTITNELIPMPGVTSVEILPPNPNRQTVYIESAVSHPSHYNAGKIEVIEALEDWKLNFHLGNAVKYIARAGKKNADKEVEDLEKAVWYLKRKIELLAAAKENREIVRPNDMNPRATKESISATAVLGSAPSAPTLDSARNAAPFKMLWGEWLKFQTEAGDTVAFFPAGGSTSWWKLDGKTMEIWGAFE